MTRDTAAEGPEAVELLKRKLARERRARQQAESIAEAGLRQLYEEQQRLHRLLEETVTAANTALSLRAVIPTVLESVCRYRGWKLGHAWLTSAEDGGLIDSGFWHSDELERYRAFIQASADSRFSSGVGLPGRVLVEGRPLWLTNADKDTNFPRAPFATQAGLQSGFAFPILVGRSVEAVLEFFTDAVVPPEQELLRVLAQIGTQLGRVAERELTMQKLTYTATHDPLTQLPNRALILERIGEAAARQQAAPDTLIALLFLDLDRFKFINDSMGHLCGDQLLIQVTKRLAKALQERGRPDERAAPARRHTLARFGGDEFVVLLEGLRRLEDAAEVATRLERAMVEPFTLDGLQLHVTASIGITTNLTSSTHTTNLIRDADIAMYKAKASGLGRSALYDEQLHPIALARLALEADLHQALKRRQFVLHYQPIVSLQSGEISGWEALVRWQKPSGELVYPLDFIDAAEQSGLIVPLGRWVLEEACRMLQKLERDADRRSRPGMNVNVSALQLRDATFLADVERILKETGITPSLLHLEITESVARDGARRTTELLSRLRQLGVRVVLDDFGMGYSCLNDLRQFAPDMLKIDRAFVSQMYSDKYSIQIIQSIIALAKNFNMGTVAEGIENPSELEDLAALGCNLAQGYLFSPAVDAASVARMTRGAGPVSQPDRTSRPALAHLGKRA